MSQALGSDPSLGGPAEGGASTKRAGPLSGLRVVEFQGSGPGPFAGMILADAGADVLLVDRVGPTHLGKYGERRYEVLMRNKRSVMVDLKSEAGRDATLDIIARADVVIDVMRPGSMERLGLGPRECLARNQRLVYGRMTGWGQDGPRAHAAGHDINYVAISGILSAIGPASSPVIPLNLIGDMGGGGLLLAFGIVCALQEVTRSGRGQVVDAAMLEGASLLGTLFHGMLAAGRWRDQRGGNHLDGSAPWYAVYATSDGGFMAVGANEEHFYAALLDGLGLTAEILPDRSDPGAWPTLRARFADVFGSRSRAEWTRIFATIDACVTPVLSMGEAVDDAHNRARRAYQNVAGITQPAPAPRFSLTPAGVASAPPRRGEGGREMLRAWGVDDPALRQLARDGIGFLNE